MNRILKTQSGIAALSFLILIAACVSVHWSRENLRIEQAKVNLALEKPPLYLPSERYVRLITLGFDGFFSDILWFNTVSYFGKQFYGTQDFRWFSQMCHLVTELDPNAHHAFEFCATLLSWVAKEPENSTRLLCRAIEFHPQRWRYHYLRGFNYWYFLKDPDRAKQDLVKASKMPGSPVFLASLASRLLVSREDPKNAIRFLRDILKNTKDKTAKKALLDKLKRAHLSYHLKLLNEAKLLFEKQHKRPLQGVEELVSESIIDRVPKEPFGGTYVIDEQTNSIVNSSKERGLEFFGKTVHTGLAKNEFKKAGDEHGDSSN